MGLAHRESLGVQYRSQIRVVLRDDLEVKNGSGLARHFSWLVRRSSVLFAIIRLGYPLSLIFLDADSWPDWICGGGEVLIDG